MAYFPLHDAFVFEVKGRDACRYLHSRLSNDIKKIALGEHVFAAALSPVGRALGVFCVYRIGQDAYLVVCDGGNPNEVKQGLLQYKVSEQLQAEILTDIAIAHAAPQQALKLQHALQLEQLSLEFLTDLPCFDGFCLPRTRTTASGWDILVAKRYESELIGLLESTSSPKLDKNEQLKARVLGNRPSFPEEINSERVFSEYGLKEALSFSKGCYVGQEVIERVDSRGRAPRRLIRIHSDSQFTAIPGQKLKVSSPAKPEEGWDATLLSKTDFPAGEDNFAFLLISSKAPETEDLQIEGVQAKVL